MKRVFSALLVVLMLLSCFAGCTKPASNNGTTGTSANNTSESTLTVNPDGLSLEEDGVVYESLAQKAVVKTALAYLARGTRIQYDDTRLNVRSAPEANGALYRWQSGVRKSPEEYTTQHTGYSNCAAFTYEVYLAALNLNVGVNYTEGLAAIKDARRAYRYNPTGKETDAEKAAVQEAFLSTLKMGDIIVVRRHDTSGHAMLYVGSKVLENVEGYKGAAAEGVDDNGVPNDTGYVYDIIHSTGSSYNYEKATEKYEKHGTIQITAANSLFDSKSYSYVFGKLTSLTIIRPLNVFKKDVPENSKNRMLYMENIIAEKLSSHTVGMTVNPGDHITYTFSITNKNKTDVTLEVKDTLPENTTYVSSENCTVDGVNLSWTVKVPAEQTVTVSYVAKVNTDVQPGQCVESKGGSVGGIATNCPKVYVGTTLTEAQQTALRNAVAANTDSKLRGMALANALYNEVLDTKDILPDDYATVLSGIFRPAGNYFYIEWNESAYRDAVVPGLFGGRYVPQRSVSVDLMQQVQMHENNRTRLPQTEHLIAGDIIIAAQDAKAEKQKLYLFTGEKMLDLNSGDTLTYLETQECLEPIMACNRFAVLRPSLLLDKTAQ